MSVAGVQQKQQPAEDGLGQLAHLGKYYLVSSLIQGAVPFLLMPLYTRYLSVKDYGLLTLIYLTLGTFQNIVRGPVNAGLTRFYYQVPQGSARGQLIYGGLVFMLWQLLLLAAAFWLLAPHIGQLLLDNPEATGLVHVMAVILVTRALSDYAFDILRIQGQARRFLAANLISLLLVAGSQIIMLVWFNFGLAAMVYGLLISSLTTLLLLTPYLVRSIDWKLDRTMLRQQLAYGYPLVLASMLFMLIESADKYVLRYFGYEQELGLLAVAVRFTSILTILVQIPLKQAFFPVVMQMEGDKPGLLGFIRRSASYVWLLLHLLAFGLIAFGRDLIDLMTAKDEFLAAWPLLPFLLVYTILFSMEVFFLNGLAMAKRSVAIGLTFLFALGVQLGILLAAVPQWGIWGVCISAVVAPILTSLLRVYLSYRAYGQTFEWRRMLLVSAVFAACSAAAMSLQYMVPSLLPSLALRGLLTGLVIAFSWRWLLDAADRQLLVAGLQQRFPFLLPMRNSGS